MKRILDLVSHATSRTYLQKLRHAMVRPNRGCLHVRVEVDETSRGAHEEGVTGRQTESKALIVVAAEEDGKGIFHIRLRRIPDLTITSMHRFIAQSVAAASTVCTDGLHAHLGLKRYVYNQQVKRQRPDGEFLMPRVHRVVSLLKRWLLGTYQIAMRHNRLDYYLDAFTFRFITDVRRHHGGEVFSRLLKHAVQIDSVPSKKIVCGKYYAPLGQTGKLSCGVN